MMKRSFGVFLVVFMLVACGGENRQSIDLNSGELVFQEIHPENEGRIESKTLTLKKWTWHQDLSVGDVLVFGTHYTFPISMVPLGLELQLKVTGKRTVEISFLGQAENHHVRNSFRGAILEFKQALFLNNAPDSVKEEIVNYEVGIQFGKGFQLKGTITNPSEEITIKDIITQDELDLGQGSVKFAFPEVYEAGDRYLLQFEKLADQLCCHFDKAKGVFDASDEELILYCNPPQWRHPTSLSDAMIFPYEFGYSYLSGGNLIAHPFDDSYFGESFSKNKYGDYVFGNRNYLTDYTINGNGVLGLFLARYHRASNQWDFSNNLSYADPANLLIPHYTGSVNGQGVLNSTVLTNGVFQKMALLNNQELFVLHSQTNGNQYYYNHLETVYNGFDVLKKPTHIVDDQEQFGEDDSVLYLDQKVFENGNVIRVYSEMSEMYYRFKPMGGQFSTGEKISPPIDSFGQNHFFPTILVDEKGNGAIFWRSFLYAGTPSTVHLFKADVQNFGIASVPSSFQDSLLPTNTINSISQEIDPVTSISANGDIRILFVATHTSQQTSFHRLFLIEKIGGQWHFPSNHQDYINPYFSGGNTSQNQIQAMDLIQDDQGRAMIAWTQGYELYGMSSENENWSNYQKISSSYNYVINQGAYNYVADNFRIKLTNDKKFQIVFVERDQIFSNGSEAYRLRYSQKNGSTFSTSLVHSATSLITALDAFDHGHMQSVLFKKGNHLYKKDHHFGQWINETTLHSQIEDSISSPVSKYRYSSQENQCGWTSIVWQLDGSNLSNSKTMVTQYR